MDVKKIGEFMLASGTMGAGDPCYGGASQSFPALNGLWEVAVEYTHDFWGRRVMSLLVSNKNGRPVGGYNDLGHINVDSGQAGFFDIKIEDLLNEEYYDQICNLTLSENQGGVIQAGAFTSTGYGDGSYDLKVRYDENGKATDAVIEYISSDG